MLRPEHWQDIKNLYHAALQCEEAERATFLEEACARDEGLRREVESLLGYAGQVEGFISSPALDVAAIELARDRKSALLGKQFGAYRVVSLLGAGGMGEVYLARDTSLDRQVALKFLPEHLQNDEIARKRFLREARSAAALDHPFICNVHEIVEVDGRDFISMEYIEGHTLREKLRDGPLPVKQALRIAAEIAEALEKAHDGGIVHRDLKPSNVMLTSAGHVKVMDFGLAKRVTEEVGSQDVALMQLTQEGTTIGTVPYMPPEQLRGESVDTRSDIFSFGVMLYEMLAGVHPFRKSTRMETASSILEEDPTPLADHDTEVSESIRHMVKKLLAKDPALRYQSIQDVRTDLRELGSLGEAQSPSSGRFGKLGRVAVITVLSVVSGAALAGWFSGDTAGSVAPGEITSLAVLPLENLSANAEQDFVVQGMHDELIHNLARISALRVISRSSVMQYAQQKRPLAEIAEELNVDALVEGTVRREGDQVRVTAQLIAFNPERHLWTATLDGDIRDALKLQSDVAQVIAAEISVALTPEERSRLARSRPTDPRVLDAYMKGLVQRNRWSRESLPRAIEYFHKALDIDPGFAQAWAGLVVTHTQLALFMTSLEERTRHRRLAKEAAVKAVTLDDSLAEAHAGLGWMRMHEWDWAGAEKEMERAIQLDPNSAEALAVHAHLLVFLGRFEEGIASQEKLIQITPGTGLEIMRLSYFLYLAERYQDSIEQARRVQEAFPNEDRRWAWTAESYAEEGLYPEAVALCDELLVSKGPDLRCARAYEQSGQPEKAYNLRSTILERSKERYTQPSRMAMIHAALGEKDRAMEWLNEAYQEGSPTMHELKVFPAYDSLRGDRPFQDLMRRLNFPE